MKRVFYRWLLLVGSLLIPTALAAVSANESPSLSDTSNAEAEVIGPTSTDGEVELGLLEYIFNRKRGEAVEQATNEGHALSGVELKEAYDGHQEELGLLDILFGKEPQQLAIATSLHEAEPVAEPQKEPLTKVGLLRYLFNRGKKPTRPASDLAPAVNRSHATVRSSTGTSQVYARSATQVKSAAMIEDLLRIKVVLGLLPRSALASLGQSNYVTATPTRDNDAPLVTNTDPQLELPQEHDTPGSATPIEMENYGLLDLLLHRRPKAIVNEEPVVANSEPKIEGAQKADSPDYATPAEVEEIGLLELLMKRRPKATATLSGDTNGNETSVIPGAEKGELGLLELLFGKDSDGPGNNVMTPADPDQSRAAESSEEEISKID